MLRRVSPLVLIVLFCAACGSSNQTKQKSASQKGTGSKKKAISKAHPKTAMGIMVGDVGETKAYVQVRLTKHDKLVDGDVAGAYGWVEFHLGPRGSNKKTISRTGVALKRYDYIVRAEFDGLKPGTLYECETKIGTYKEDPTNDHPTSADLPKTVPDPVLDATSLKPGPTATFRTLQGAATDQPARFVVVTGMNYAKFHGDNRINKAIHKKHNNRALPQPYVGDDKKLGYPALASILKLKPDFFVGTGDNVYYDTPRKPRAETIPQMRRKWHEQFVQPRYVKLFAEVPTYWEIDDHDYRIDDGDNTGDHDPSPAVAQRIMKEQLPYGRMGDPNVKTFRTYRVNKDLQVWFVENRIYRSPNKMKDGPGKSIWGSAQKQWLMKTLLQSEAKFKVLVSPNPMIGPDDARKSDNHTNFGGFRHERDEFFQWLVDKGLAKKHFYLVCGDRHWQYHSLHPLGIEEFSCGALVDANSRLGRKPGDPKSTDPDAKIKQVYTQTTPSGGFLMVSVAPAKDETPATLTFTFYDETGKVLYQHSKK